ncbi:MAG: flagellar biosynthetic protein FliO [Verrucomicrobiota bacterium]
MSRIGSITLLLFGTLGPMSAETNVLQSIPTAPTLSAAMALFRVLGALALVLALFFGGLWLFKHWQGLIAGGRRPRQLAVLEVCSLGNRQALYLVRCGTQRFLLSSAVNGVSMVSQLPEGEPEPAPSPIPPAQGFAEKLQKALHRS